MKFCQSPKCHTYKTKDRIKGTQGSKTYQTRRRSSFYYGDGNFCSLTCYNDWANEFADRAIDHFGRITEAKHLTEDNAWVKDYDWRASADRSHIYFFVNGITKERRPISEEQYEDRNYTLNTI
jgi:hypothetical protein